MKRPALPLYCARLVLAAAVFAIASPLARAAEPLEGKHNVIIFVADGLRHGAVDTGFMPTFAEVRKNGVDFVNSHSLYPTVTTANASAIATGHYLGDTGDFGNTIFTGFPSLPSDGWSGTHAIENDAAIPDLNEHYSGSFIPEQTFIATARKAGFHTAVLGKLGPTLIQDLTINNPGMTAQNMQTIFFDDLTGAALPKSGERGAVPLPAEFSRRIAADPYFLQKYFKDAPPAGDPRTLARTANNTTGTKVANTIQQTYLADMLTRGVLPYFTDPKGDHKPFALVYWSRDPDGTQHNQLDGPDELTTGINGPTVHLAFQNVDNNLKQLLEYLRATPDPREPQKKLIDTTDLFITSDHGFGTVSRSAIDLQGTRIESFATRQRYKGTTPGFLPKGVIAIDLAHDLDLPLYDADTSATTAAGLQYKPLKVGGTEGEGNWADQPSSGAGFIGGTGVFDKDGFSSPLLVIGGTIYLPPQRPRAGQRAEDPAALMRRVVASLVDKQYVSGVFVDTQRFGEIPGALSLADINLSGAAITPRPAAMVNFRSFCTDPANPYMTGVWVCDGGYREGGGNHGSFGRHDTYNCMMAIGPDFKSQFSDPDPVSNADIAVTLSHLLGIDVRAHARGRLTGRVIAEALANGPAPRGAQVLRKTSQPAANGITTVLQYQSCTDADGTYLYFDAAGFPGRTNGLDK